MVFLGDPPQWRHLRASLPRFPVSLHGLLWLCDRRSRAQGVGLLLVPEFRDWYLDDKKSGLSHPHPSASTACPACAALCTSPSPQPCEHLACCCMPNQHGSELILPVCAGFRNSGAPSCARQEKSGAQPLRAQAPAPFSSQCPLARCTCRRCFECLAGWLTWRLDRRQRGLETKSPSREGDFFQVEVAHFNAPGEHSR